jgi:hypothetical protein
MPKISNSDTSTISMALIVSDRRGIHGFVGEVIIIEKVLGPTRFKK